MESSCSCENLGKVSRWSPRISIQTRQTEAFMCAAAAPLTPTQSIDERRKLLNESLYPREFQRRLDSIVSKKKMRRRKTMVCQLQACRRDCFVLTHITRQQNTAPSPHQMCDLSAFQTLSCFLTYENDYHTRSYGIYSFPMFAPKRSQQETF